MKNNFSTVKKEKKRSLYLREITKLLQDLSEEEKQVAQIYPTRVALSSDNGICYIYFSTFSEEDQEKSVKIFDEALEVLKLYKSSMRKALGKKICCRYVPDLIFHYDEKRCKVNKINKLLSNVQKELDNYDESQ